MQGWIKLHRQLTKWEWYDDANTFRLFMHLLLTANHERNNWRGIDVKAGQNIVGRKKLADALKLSERQIRTSLKKLKSTNEIAIETTNKYTLITIVNWGLYQEDEKKTTNKTTNKLPTNDQQVTTNKNDNNIKKDIVDYLNAVTDSKYKHTTKKTIDCINARLNDGYGIDDFKKVIDIKSKEWLNTDMQQYLRPETLFGNKFEGYLNQKVIKFKSNNDNRPDYKKAQDKQIADMMRKIGR